MRDMTNSPAVFLTLATVMDPKPPISMCMTISEWWNKHLAAEVHVRADGILFVSDYIEKHPADGSKPALESWSLCNETGWREHPWPEAMIAALNAAAWNYGIPGIS